MSVTDESEEVLAPGTKVVGHLMALPIGEPNPKIRLDQVAFGTMPTPTAAGRSMRAPSPIWPASPRAPCTRSAYGSVGGTWSVARTTC